MASPQVENGYTMLANELLEAYSMIRVSGEENQLFWFIIRKTYGFKKKEDAISLSQFSIGTGINKPNVCRALSNLIKKNLIIKNDNGLITSYRIQKDYAKWKALSKKIRLSKEIIDPINIDNNPIIKNDTYKRNKNTKETLTKERCENKISYSIDKKLTQLLIDLILKNDPNSSIVRRLTEKRQIEWMDACRKLREIDKRNSKLIEQIIIFSQEDDFWKANILSMPKLREKFDQLFHKAKKGRFSGIKEWLSSTNGQE